jgi:hypothetical protein
MPDRRDFVASIAVECLTPQAVQKLTGLDWQHIETKQDASQKPGIYVWAASEASPIVYHGRAVGKSGLRGRLANELRWQAEHRELYDKTRENGADVLGWNVTQEVPMVQGVVHHQAKCWAAVATTAPWPNWQWKDADAPSTAQEWESFISECSRILAGHRGLLGGGAWESKSGTVASRMASSAWARIHDLHALDSGL